MRVLDFGAKADFIRDCIERWITADSGLSSQIQPRLAFGTLSDTKCRHFVLHEDDTFTTREFSIPSCCYAACCKATMVMAEGAVERK
jgi:hypothetical protein